MPMLIDELIVALKLDPKNFDDEQARALERFKKTTEAAKKQGDVLEGIGKKAEETYSKARGQLLAFGAALLGAGSIEQFIVSQTRTNLQVGRLAGLLDMNTEGLSKWRIASQLAGGSADDMASAMRTMTLQMVNAAATGDQSMIPIFNALHVDVSKAARSGADMEKVFFDLSDRFKQLSPQWRLFFGSQFGWNDHQISMMSKGGDELRKLLDKAGELHPITERDAAAARQLTEAWNAAANAAEGLGRRISTSLSPSLSKFLDEVTLLLQGKPLPGAADMPKSGFGPSSGAGRSVLDILFENKPKSVNDIFRELSESRQSTLASRALPRKPGAGVSSATTDAILNAISGVEGLDRVTALNDHFHQGRGGLHPRGRAVDITVKQGADPDKVATEVRAALARAGIGASVLNEYSNPSAGATGGHLHIGARDLAAGGGQSSSNTTRTDVDIGTLNVYSAAKDAGGIGADISESIARQSFAVQAQHGGM